ncbi:MAG: insulinase family protein [Ruminococcus sp.]|nr:insulinase family protein [Ruminococcus sp.]
MQTGDTLHGFKVTQIREIPQLDGRLVQMRHEDCGAELCWLDNGASNKLFSVAFKTLPCDDTGVFHILEHTVLCGSAKFPVKEPFVDLLKGSMQTFLNAMTYPDKTVYPISSRNKQDFLNLTEVYLDAVFAPRLKQDPSIFMQEGWHMEFDENGEPLFKGVVFNEMKGALSSVDEVIEVGMNRLLFPDNCYKYVSGGAPVSIPDLTYKQYCDTYDEFYHPSNARFYLDGDVPLDETLEMISSYISGTKPLDKLPELAMQKPAANSAVQRYEIGEEESPENRTHFTMGKIIGSHQDKTKNMAADVLAEYLAGTNESPLKKAILDAGLGQDVIIGMYDGIAQPWFMLSVRNLDSSKTDELKQLIKSTIADILAKGIDKMTVKACINSMEFQKRLMYEPQGLTRCISALDSWLYGGDPILYLVHDDNFAELRAMADGDGFEKLMEEIFSNENMCTLVSEPDKTLGREQSDAENAELKKRCEAMTDSDREALDKANENLTAWQAAPDSPEAKATLPTLPLSEISPKPEKTETTVTEKDGVKIVKYSVPSHGITHFKLYFAIPELSLAELSKAVFLTELLGSMPTEKHSVSELEQLIKYYIGSLTFGIRVFAEKGDRKRCMPKLCVNCSVLDSNIEKAVEIITEILTETDLSGKEMVRNILLQTEENNRQGAIMNGHRIGMKETLAHYSAVGAANEAVDGAGYMQTVHQLVQSFDTEIDGTVALLNDILKKAVCMSRLVISVTSDKDNDILGYLNFPKGSAVSPYAEYKTEVPEKMGLAIPAPVSYAVQGWHFGERVGSLETAAKIMSLDYLWNNVRVQGGAYGSGLLALLNGDVACYSYRDPSPARSVSMYAKMGEALRKWCDGGESLDNYIISTVAATEPLVSPKNVSVTEDEYFFAGVSYEDRVERRRQILGTTKSDLLGLCDKLAEIGEQGSVCVVSNMETLKSIDGLETVAM